MENVSKYLFVYGSLLDYTNEFGRYLRTNSQYIAKGSFNGLLFDLGEYPGAIYDKTMAAEVFGDVMLLNDDPDILKKIDEYEGYGDDPAQPDLFIRQQIPVKSNAGVFNCWVYLYNLPVTGHRQIKGGRYKA